MTAAELRTAAKDHAAVARAARIAAQIAYSNSIDDLGNYLWVAFANARDRAIELMLAAKAAEAKAAEAEARV